MPLVARDHAHFPRTLMQIIPATRANNATVTLFQDASLSEELVEEQQ